MTENKEILQQNNSQLQKLTDALNKEHFFEKFPTAKLYNLWKWIFSAEIENNVIFYFKEDWHMIFNLSAMRKNLSDKNSFNKANVVERIENNSVELYQVNNDNWNKTISESPIDKKSIEYFNARIDILFFDNRSFLNKFFQNNADKTNIHQQRIDYLEFLISPVWALKLWEAYNIFKKDWLSKWWFQKLLKYYTDKNNPILLNQCSDPRFEKNWEQLTPEEIQKYLQEWLISKELANECINAIQERDNLNKQKETEKSKITSEISWKLDDLKSLIV